MSTVEMAAAPVAPASAANNLVDEKAIIPSAVEIQNPEGRPQCFKSTTQEVLFVLTATMAIAMGAFLSGAVSVISASVGADLGMTTAEITWMSSANTLAGGAFLLLFGKLADCFGRKMMFVLSLFFFAVLSLAAGFSKTPIVLDVLNGMMGLMTAASVPPAQGLLGTIYEKPSRRKNAAFACFSAGNPLGFVFGTIFSGIASDLFNWRASFFLLAIIYLVFSALAMFTVPKDTTNKEPFNWTTVKKLDPVGVVLTIAGVGMFCAALSSGDTATNGWKTDYIIAMLIVGAALIVAFVFWELYYPHPLVPMSIWRDKNFSLVMIVLLFGMMAFSVAEFFLALYMQEVWKWSPLTTAVHLLPMAIMGIIVNIVAGMIMHRVSNKALMLVGCFGYTIAFTLIAVNTIHSSYWAFCFPSFLLAVVGADLEFNVANLYVASSMPVHQQSIAGSIVQTVTKLCQSVGFGIGTAVFNAVGRSAKEGGRWDVATKPYSAVFWFAAAASGTSIVFATFLTIGTQGGKEKGEDEDEGEGSGEAKQ
ncbi:putative transporter [Aureobasidium pullulans]|uniref:Putative transporter n=1 Tax=Aureobasidium pullulans TaxID=5580 RepID=A0A4S9N542_AURPU|nr:putative transporter [Aureobasidium pullulans]THY51140.1 putative transporter [Aureobasidium pullulans]THZ80879.1 putative transporter [Aureobasidium pullulans]TIA38588.1 putative transporter [Aureobasidium pullulans]